KWLTADRDKGTRVFSSVADGLQSLYKEKLLPLEKDFSFAHFFSPELTDADFSARPMVMLTGQYSTGKSTFIRHLLGRDYPGLRIGPEPTTDKFVAVCHGDMDQVIPGNALVVDKSMPFTQLSHFGNNFLTRFECAKLNSPVLNGMSLIDTPGVLSGEKQRIKRCGLTLHQQHVLLGRSSRCKCKAVQGGYEFEVCPPLHHLHAAFDVN
ncbi:unnamed protein product, partial [Effrenium voratum]